VTKIAETPVLPAVPGGGHVLVSNPSGIDPAKFVFARVPTSAISALASTTPPAMDGTAAAGSSTTYARGDHVHPSDTSRYAASNPAGYQTAAQVAAAQPPASTILPGMDGAAAIGITLSYARSDHIHPTDTSRAAASALPGLATTSTPGLVKPDGTTITVDGAGKIAAVSSGGAATYVGDTPPGSPTAGQLWWESDSGNLFIYYADGTSSQWVQAAAGAAASVPANVADYVIGVTQPGVSGNAQKLLVHKLPHAITLPASLAGSSATALTAATASTAFVLAYVRSGSTTTIATFTFAAAGTVATISGVVIPTLAAGDVLTITGPATADATLADIGFSLLGTKQ
jgi:hypothetical protein